LSNSRGDQHFASGSAGFAQIAVRIANAAAASSQLLAIFWVEVGLHDLNAAPIAAELLRHDHRSDVRTPCPISDLPHQIFTSPLPDSSSQAFGEKELEAGKRRKGERAVFQPDEKAEGVRLQPQRRISESHDEEG